MSLRPQLLHLFRAGAAKDGGFGLDADSFAFRAIEALEGRLRAAGVVPDPSSLERAISALPAADFLLAIAFRHGDRDAARHVLHRELTLHLRRGYRRFGATPEQAETSTAELIENLLFGAFRRSGEPGFLGYEAKTSLESWAAGIAWHDLRSRGRASARRKVVSEADLRANDGEEQTRAPEPAADARREVAAELSDVAPVLRRALDEAAQGGAVPERDLEAYVHATLSRRPHQDLAARLGIPPSTFSRRRERGANALANAAKEALLLRVKPKEYLRLQKSLELELSAANALLFETTRAFCRAQRRRLPRRRRMPQEAIAPLSAQEPP
ncbi:MAG: sigma-70 family RNA polymerase sigma factor [Planctomycetes bacterium]|nr:sigma-70 family RNA polymerase sigma factor [Planctomycetota bacterium]